MFDALANDPELHFGMQLQPGDMQFVYNHSQLHDRTGFVDWPEPARKRHLLRLWLSVARGPAVAGMLQGALWLHRDRQAGRHRDKGNTAARATGLTYPVKPLRPDRSARCTKGE